MKRSCTVHREQAPQFSAERRLELCPEYTHGKQTASRKME